MFSPATASRAARLDTLRELLRQRDALLVEAPRRVVSTGRAPLDALLPGGGFPRGGVSEVLGALGSGKATLVARAAAALLDKGAPVAWISGRGPLYAPALAGLAVPTPALLQICPADPARVVWAAEQVLRSDTFALVLLDAVHPGGRPVLDDAGFRRLAGAARGSGGALVLLSEPPGGLPLQPLPADLSLAVRPVSELGRPSGLPLRPPAAPAVPSAGDSPARTISTVRRNRKVEVTLLHGRGLPPGRQVVLEV